MGLGHGGMTWGMCRNGCPLRAMVGGDVTLDGDIFNRGTGVMTDRGEVDNDDNDDGDDDDDGDSDEGDLVDETGGERGEKRSNDEEGDDEDEDDDGEERDLLVERSTGSVWIWNGSDGNRFSGEWVWNLLSITRTPMSA